MEFLKKLLSEETYNKLVEELKGKDVSLANLKSGEYVSKAKYDALETSANDYKSKLEAKETEYNTLSQKAGDNETLKNEIETLKANSKKDLDDLKASYNDKLLKNAIEKELIKSKAKDPKDVINNIDLNIVKFDNDKLVGLEEQVKNLKESKEYLFESETPNQPDSMKKTGVQHGNDTGDGDMDKYRKAMGLPSEK